MSVDELRNSKIELDNSELERLFVCPITMLPIEVPVVTPQGNIFEKATIEKWATIHQTCPLTKQPLDISDIKPAKFSS